MADTRTASEKILALMELRGISQNVLALRSGVKQRTISGIVNGNSPRIDNAARLADALDVSLDWLAGRERKHQPEIDPEQQALLKAFAELDRAGRELLLNMARGLAAQRK